jgi:hypothetical protein
VDPKHQAEAELTGAGSRLSDALMARAPEPVVRHLVADYDAAFDRWAKACHFDLSRSSFEQRAGASPG